MVIVKSYVLVSGSKNKRQVKRAMYDTYKDAMDDIDLCVKKLYQAYMRKIGLCIVDVARDAHKVVATVKPAINLYKQVAYNFDIIA